MMQNLPDVFDQQQFYLKDTLPAVGQREFCPENTTLTSDLPEPTQISCILEMKEKYAN